MTTAQAAQAQVNKLTAALNQATAIYTREWLTKRLNTWQDILDEALAGEIEDTKRCRNCEGRGVLYFGAPDALGTETETCSRCNGKGKVMSVQD